MACDPQSLIDAYSCLRCIPDGMVPAVRVALMCEWAGGVTPPVGGFSYTPDTAIIAWVDSGGSKSGNLAAFNATADIATVSSVTGINIGLTGISGLSTLPALFRLDVSNNAGLTSLDLTGCASLNFLNCSSCPVATLDVSDCVVLDQLLCSDCSLTELILSSNTALTVVDCDDNQITSLDFLAHPILTNLYCDNNALTHLSTSGCPTLNTLFCNTNPGVGVLDLTPNTALVLLQCGSTGLVNMTLAGLSALVGIAATSNSFDVDVINAILVELDTAGGLNGTIDISGQAPPASPSLGPPNGIAAAASLFIKGWTVTTD